MFDENDGKIYTQNEIGLRIRSYRKEKGLSQTELAERIGKSLRTIQKYERGEIEMSVAVLNLIATVLDCSTLHLIGYNASRRPIENFSDFANFLFELEMIKELDFSVNAALSPFDNEWKCSITFDLEKCGFPLNTTLGYFFKEFSDQKTAFAESQISLKEHLDWMNKILRSTENLLLTQKDYGISVKEWRHPSSNTGQKN